MLELPDRHAVEVHFDIFRTTLMQRVFPIVDPILFPDTIKVAYSHSGVSAWRADIRACILSFLAFSSILQVPEYKDRPLSLPPIDSEGLALKAQCLIPQVLREDAGLEGLQALIIMVSRHARLASCKLPCKLRDFTVSFFNKADRFIGALRTSHW